MQGIEISKSDFTKANFQGSDLSYSQFTDVDLKQADFTQSNLKGATFTQVDFSECTIHPQNLEIDETTQFNDIKCDFVYLQENNTSEEKRYPPDGGNFVRGEFDQFIRGNIDMNDSQKGIKRLDGSDYPYRSVLKNVVHQDEIERLQDEVNFL